MVRTIRAPRTLEQRGLAACDFTSGEQVAGVVDRVSRTVKFAEFLKRDTGSQDIVVPPTTLARLERKLKDGMRLSSLMQERRELLDSLPVEHLRDIVESYRRYTIWRAAAARVARRLESVEREVISRTTKLHQLALVERALKLAEQGRVEALDRPGVLSVALEIWESCRAEVRRRGRVRCTLTSPDHPLAEQHGDYVNRSEDLDALRPHRWLAMRRGEREGALSIELDLAAIPLLEQLSVRLKRLGAAAKDRTEQSLIQELVLDDLKSAVFEDADDWATTKALKFACESYAGLLRSRPLKVDRLCALFMGTPRQPVGCAVLDGVGDVLDTLQIDTAQRGWMEKVVQWIAVMEIPVLAVPSDTRSSKRLSEIEVKLGAAVSLVPVRPAALSEARKCLETSDGENLPKVAANAVILGRRALDPSKAWGEIDPVRTGVGEYQSELDEEDLREALTATLSIVRSEGARAAAPPEAVVKKTAPLGPMVSKASELRSGMTVSGQVTNITGFGAFVALGLEYEGMIHVSELSDEYVSNPHEVVNIGDKVSARVLAVDPKRRRISLSLRSPVERDRRNPRSKGGPHRHQALRDLEQLFKKE